MHMPSQHILVAKAHIHCDPEFADIQTLMLTNELNNIIMKAQTEGGIGFKTPIPGMPGVPVIMCCDLNSLPDSSVVEYLRTGCIATSHRDLQGHGYDGFLQQFSASVRGGIRAPSQWAR
jgi:CCR4-NOT transcription complex subunit 6